MDKNFDWQTEDTVDWDQLPPAAAETEKLAGHRRLHRVWWLLLLGLLLAGSWLAVRQVTARVAEVRAEATADLLATHDLLLQAAAGQDEDVVRSLLSGREAAWLATQTDLVAAGLWLERTPLGLTYQESPAAAVTVTLSADLFSAEMVYDVIYRSQTAEPVTLQQTAVYRRGVDRWLYAPPEADYWGAWEEQEYPRLTLSYPQRDAALAQRLGPALSQAITDLCLVVEGMHCPADFRVRLRLDTEPDSLLVLAAAVLPHDQRAYHYRLPTPTLLGRPLDEVAYTTWQQAYTNRLLGGLVADQTNYSCCRQVALFQALLDYQLSQIGLKEWPLNERHYRSLMAGEDLPPGLGLAFFWRTRETAVLTSDNGWLVYLLVEYLLREGDYRSAAAWQQMLDTPQELYTLLGTMTAINSYQQISSRLWNYAYIQSLTRETTAEPPRPLPTQDLLLSCSAPTAHGPAPIMRLLRYTPATNQWLVEDEYIGYPALYAAPDRDGVLLMNVAEQPEQPWPLGLHITRWRDGHFQRLSPAETNMYMSGFRSPDGRFLVAVQYADEQMQPVLLDLAACDEAGCQAQALDNVAGGLFWSPNSRRTLILAEQERAGSGFSFPSLFSLWLGDEQGRPLATEPIALARSPFWVDDETFGYITLDEGDRATVMLVSGESGQLLIEPDRFTEHMAYIMANPYRPHQYLVQLRHNNGWRLVAYDATNQVTTTIMSQETEGWANIPIITGDYLLLLNQRREQPHQLLVYHLRQATSHTYYLVSNDNWLTPHERLAETASGEWLALLLNEHHLLLALPHLGYQRLVEHPNLQNCHGLAWAN